MTVCTNHVALVDLGEDGGPAVIAQALRDTEALVTEVIELEYKWICLAAVRAGPRAEKLDQVFGSLAGDSPAPA